jgi:hypothetical protein
VALALVVGLVVFGLALAIPCGWLVGVGCFCFYVLVGGGICSALRIVKVLLKCVWVVLIFKNVKKMY